MFRRPIYGDPVRVCVRAESGNSAEPYFLHENDGGSSGLKKRREEEIHPPHVNGDDLYRRNNHREGEGGVTFGGGVERSRAEALTGAEGLGAGSLSVSMASPALRSSSEESPVETRGVR